MSRIPAPALQLGLAGLLPFAYGMLLVIGAPGTWPTFGLFPSDPGGGRMILVSYGAAILAFMGGCLWGFVAAPAGRPTLPRLAASTLPALIAFLAIRDNPALSCLVLAFGFALLLAIDVAFQRAGIAPDWWLALRVPLSIVVIVCLLVGALHG